MYGDVLPFDVPDWCVNCERPQDEHPGKRCHYWPWSKAIWCQECDMPVDDEHMGDVHDEPLPPIEFEKPDRPSALKGRAIPQRDITR